MATKKVTATITAAALASETPNRKIVLTGLKVDNVKSAQDVQVYIEDSFTSDACKTTAGVTYAAQTVTGSSRLRRLQVTVKGGEEVSLGEEDLKDVEFIGDMYHLEDVTESNCAIIAQFHTE